MLHRDYLVIGAGVGGASVCAGVRAYDRQGSVMLVGYESVAGYRRPELCQRYLAPNLEETERTPVGAQLPEDIDLRLEQTVSHLNLERRVAVLGSGAAVEFRKACLAMGGRVRRPVVAGANLGHVFYLRSWRELLALREAAQERGPIVVVGGGCLAAQVASSLARWPDSQVMLLHRGQWLWSRWLDPVAAAWLTDYFRECGVQMRMGEILNGFEGRTVLRNVQTKSGQRYSANLAVVALGVELNLSLVNQTPLGYPNGTPVNEFLESEEKGIYAVGDIAAYPDRIFGGTRRLEQWEGVVAQGELAGANMTGRKRQRFEWIPHRHASLFDLEIDLVGDFSRPPSQVEMEGELQSKSFILRYYSQGECTGAVLCNQGEEKISALKTHFREHIRESKRRVA